MNLSRNQLDVLNQYGLNIDGSSRNIPDDLVVELPCSLKRTDVKMQVEFGAFSYMVSGYLCATKIGRYCSIGENVQIGRQNHPIEWITTSPFLYRQGNKVAKFPKEFTSCLNEDDFNYPHNPTKIKKTTIYNDVYIGHGAIINAGVTINNGAIIASGSVVTKDVLPYAIVGGNPAKFIRWRFDEKIINSLQDTQWWKYTPKQLHGLAIHAPDDFIKNFNLRKLERYAFSKIKLIDIYMKEFK